MSGDLTPRQGELRMSDADRERVVAYLQSVVGQGLLTLDEFQERVDAVLKARTFGEADRLLADLPEMPFARPGPPREVAEIRSTAASLRRRGRWNVPRRLHVRARAGSVRLDFTEALISSPMVEIVLDVVAGSTTLILPDGASVNADEVEMIAGGVKVRRLPSEPGLAGGPHFAVSGTQKAGGLVIRRQHRFWHWRW